MSDIVAACQNEHSQHFSATMRTALAPTTWLVLGEHTQAYGGIALALPLAAPVAVSVTLRDDDVITVRETWAGTTSDSQCTYKDADQWHADRKKQQQSAATTAIRAALLIHTASFRQMLYHSAHGMDITIVSELAPDAGIGTRAAADVALCLALVDVQDQGEDAPLRTKIADACYHVSKLVDAQSQPRCRYTAALRAREQHLTLIDDIDESVTFVQDRLTRGNFATALCVLQLPEPTTDDLSERAAFFEQAAHAFAAPSLRQLPDASTRVLAWLQANHEVRGSSDFIALSTAEQWLRFAERECARVREAERALHSRGSRSILQIINDSQTELVADFGIGQRQAALAQLAQQWGAPAARAAQAGIGRSVVALVEPAELPDFLEQAQGAGITAWAATAGSAATVLPS